jgi:transposase InsO family protein
MIRSFLHELKVAQARTGSCARALCAGLPGSTIRRWQQRQRQGLPLLQTPGPKKNQPPDWPLILTQVKSLDHGRRRSHGATVLYQEHRLEISRRHGQQLVRQERDRQLDHMKRIHWLRPGTAWSIDATHYQGSHLVPLHDLASRYRFAPLVCSREDGAQIAAFLDHAFREHGAPLLLKRDNGSPFNCQQVNAVLAQHGVLPLNSPPHYPRYNGAMEKSIGDFKRRLSARLLTPAEDRWLAAAVETTTHELNHRPRRCLQGKTACEIYHDADLHLRLERRIRRRILRLLEAEFCRNVQLMAAEDQHALATVWRVTVQSWLVRQGLISVGHQPKPNQIVSTIFPKKWSHN